MCSYALLLTSKGDQKAEILCSKGKSNGKSEVSWHPRATWVGVCLTEIYSSPNRSNSFPICLVCALRIQPGLGCLWGLLSPQIQQGLEGKRVSPQEASRPGIPRACPSALAWAKLWSVLHFLPSGPFPLTSPVTSNYPESCLERGRESIKLTPTQM